VGGGPTFESSEPVSMMRRQRGMISVVRRNSMVGGESDLTSAPMTPRDVRRRYSNGLDFDVVFKKGYKNNGICAKRQNSGSLEDEELSGPLRKTSLVSGWEATHWRSARALQTRFEAWGVSSGGFNSGYTLIISCNKVDMTPSTSST